MDINELQKMADDKTKRGRLVKFADGKEWVIPTMPLKLQGAKISELTDKALSGNIDNNESLELITEIVRLNYPDVKNEEVNPDLESMHETIMQYTGRYLGK